MTRLLRYSLLAGALYFVAMSLAHFIALKVPVLKKRCFFAISEDARNQRNWLVFW